MAVPDNVFSHSTQKVDVVGKEAIGKQILSVTGVTTLTIPKDARKAFITVEDDNIRYWVDGSVPTATEGHLVASTGGLLLDSASQLANFKVIAATSTAKLMITYF